MAQTRTRDPLVGDVLDGRYEVLQRLAVGGMATVYRAWDRRLERIVAIKVMKEGLSDGDTDFAEKFDREARATARICDQHVVGIYDQGQDHGSPYIVMEFIEGTTLRSIMTKSGPLSPLQAILYIEQVASALAAAHDTDLIHRDIKPENMMVTGSGELKVTDFGLARSVQASTATQGVLIGTVSYLPPELLNSGRAYSWSDIYSCGIVLFEMLTGTKPYSGAPSITIAYMHTKNDVPTPSSILERKDPQRAIREPIPDYLDALVLACTRRNEKMRPCDGRELLRKVRRVRMALERHVETDLSLAASIYPSGYTSSLSEKTDKSTPSSPSRPHLAQRPSPTPAPSPIAIGKDGAALIHKAAEPVHNDRLSALSRKARRRKMRNLIVCLLAALAIAASGTGAWWYTSGRYITTPSVINHTRAEAESLAGSEHFTISFTEEYSETVPAGLVISSDPSPGDRVIRKSHINAILSKGPERYAVPHLVGLTQEEAKDALLQAHLILGKISEDWSEDIAEKQIISSSIAEGEMVKKETVVDIVISKGREPIAIPDVIGKSLDDAQHQLTDLGLSVEVSEERYDKTIEKGKVIAQDPINTTGHRNDVIHLVVSKGPEMTKIPDVIGKSRAEGVRILQEAGFDVEVSQSRNPFRATVQKVEPEAGQEAAKGSRVKVTVG